MIENFFFQETKTYLTINLKIYCIGACQILNCIVEIV